MKSTNAKTRERWQLVKFNSVSATLTVYAPQYTTQNARELIVLE